MVEGFFLSESTANDLGRLIAEWKDGFPKFRTPQRRRNTGGGGGSGTVWAVVIQRPEYNEPDKAKYIVQKASIARVSGNDVWKGDGTDIEIDRAIGYEGYDTAAENIRNWSPWFEVGAIVRIISREDIRTDSSGSVPVEKRQSGWFLAEPIVYGGDETKSSWRYNEDDNITQAVWV